MVTCKLAPAGVRKIGSGFGLPIAACMPGGMNAVPREALDGFINQTQQHVSGEVVLRLYKGHVDVLSRKSPSSLYSEDIASFTMGADYDQKDAAGFINLIGLPIKVGAAVAARQR